MIENVKIGDTVRRTRTTGTIDSSDRWRAGYTFDVQSVNGDGKSVKDPSGFWHKVEHLEPVPARPDVTPQPALANVGDIVRRIVSAGGLSKPYKMQGYKFVVQAVYAGSYADHENNWHNVHDCEIIDAPQRIAPATMYARTENGRVIEVTDNADTVKAWRNNGRIVIPFTAYHANLFIHDFHASIDKAKRIGPQSTVYVAPQPIKWPDDPHWIEVGYISTAYQHQMTKDGRWRHRKCAEPTDIDPHPWIAGKSEDAKPPFVVTVHNNIGSIGRPFKTAEERDAAADALYKTPPRQERFGTYVQPDETAAMDELIELLFDIGRRAKASATAIRDKLRR